ncbi:hypothetical protein NQU96_06605 [Pseudoalteromonas elyakovii]|jgi:hypothetical protein|uniref:hypothetical protein n=1 Tax=Pseudoalteromonas TaxID=53246 RepID=UPI0006CA3C8B|nr:MULTISPECIES: hypothetical protein [Pseudoalteromonas]KPM79050.1 hypothetical protein AOG26_06085 [Pseudoalteromonas sp. UCD-33C]MCG9734717.1 hypothetical protein [Pseudoalteromonas shioyasakiensis]MCZ4251620.1 hypothetical protein [Pseudoalteromonas shioyasakiensis]MDC3189405.1 hypothetical protein [Pseudoalteromonas elyakovii]|tara:strand:+ start:146 stop:328 length:183 start_codon:yes stop_codon:yes gene_type:complete
MTLSALLLSTLAFDAAPVSTNSVEQIKNSGGIIILNPKKKEENLNNSGGIIILNPKKKEN